jgi:predicted DCC family thiol-disulfide oxidoreductase YuxK
MNQNSSGEYWIIVYDANCAFCRAQVADISEHDKKHVFDFISNDTPALLKRFPSLKGKDLNTEVFLISPEGRLYSGSDAAYQIMRRLEFYHHFAWLYHMPILHHFARKAYKWVSRHRYKL